MTTVARPRNQRNLQARANLPPLFGTLLSYGRSTGEGAARVFRRHFDHPKIATHFATQNAAQEICNRLIYNTKVNFGVDCGGLSLRHIQILNPSKGPDWGLFSFCFKGRWQVHPPLTYGSIITAYTGPHDTITALTDDGIDQLEDMLRGARITTETWRAFLVDFVGGAELLARIKAQSPR